MGAGTLVELIARGKQDTYIIGNHQFSFFKSVYKRHTNFAIEPIKQIFTESPDFGKRVTCIIDKKADMLSDIILELELPELKTYVSWTNSIGCYIIDWVELQFGGEPIDRISGDLLDIFLELTSTVGKKQSLYKMIGKYSTFGNNTQTKAVKLLIPLPFWFCRSIEKALPLISMQYTDIKLVFQFKTFDKCWYKLIGNNTTEPSNKINITKANLLCNFVYLDVFERTKFTKELNHEYLIEQFQSINNFTVPENIINTNLKLIMNHPIKELIWTYRTDAATKHNDYYNYANIQNYNNSTDEIITSPFNEINLRFNGNDRFEKLSEIYFRLYQPYKHHKSGTNDYIYMYSFSLDPENIQPSGSCNFSKIDNITLNIEFKNNIQNGIINVYGINYNILRIQNGMSGLMFSS